MLGKTIFAAIAEACRGRELWRSGKRQVPDAAAGGRAFRV